MQNLSQATQTRGNFWITDLIAIFLISSLFYLGLAFTRPLASPDEGRYVEIPREMVADGDYITPRLNGMPYFYKPPMFYWLQAGAIKTFGINRTSARLANSMLAVFGILATYCAARLTFGRGVGIFSAAVLATSLLYFAMGQIVTLDMAVSVFIAASLFAFMVAVKKSGIPRFIAFMFVAVFASCAVLSKGLIGILIPCAIVFLYFLAVGWKNFWADFRRSDIATFAMALLLFLLLTAPWHILASLANPALENAEGIFSKTWDGQGFFWYYFVHEHFLRFVDAGTSMRYQPVWFFFVLAPVGLIPWVVFFPRAISSYIKDSRGALRTKNTQILFCLIWTAFVIGFFSISKSKLAPYIVPIYPALALAMGVWFIKWWNGQVQRPRIEQWIMVMLGYIGVIALPIAYFIQLNKGKIPDPTFAAWSMSVCGIILLIGSTLCAVQIRRNDDKKYIICLFVTVFAFLSCFNPIAQAFQRPSSEPLVKSIMPLKEDDAIVIHTNYGIYQDLPVWAERLPICVGNLPEEQRFGFMRETQKHAARFLDANGGFERFAATHKGNIYVFTRTKELDAILKRNPQLRELRREGFLVLLKQDAKK